VKAFGFSFVLDPDDILFSALDGLGIGVLNTILSLFSLLFSKSFENLL
jgi:hypothetical protein